MAGVLGQLGRGSNLSSFDPPKPESRFAVNLCGFVWQVVAVCDLASYIFAIAGARIHAQQVIANEPSRASFQATEDDIFGEHGSHSKTQLESAVCRRKRATGPLDWWSDACLFSAPSSYTLGRAATGVLL